MTRFAIRSSIFIAAIGLAPRFAFAQSSSPAQEPAPAASAPPATAPRLAPPPPPADEHGHWGFVFGVSVGYSSPAGNATTSNDSLGLTYSFQIPVTIDIGVNIFPWLFFGAYGTFADGGPGNSLHLTCVQDDCSENSWRAGLVLEYRILPGRRFQPWIGYGAGYDFTSLNITSVNQFGYTLQQQAERLRGWDLAHIRAGVDFLTDSFSAAGVFADVSLGQFTNEWTQTGSQPGVDRTIANPVLHEWITIGARWTFMP